jgi:hypothetical protein
MQHEYLNIYTAWVKPGVAAAVSRSLGIGGFRLTSVDTSLASMKPIVPSTGAIIKQEAQYYVM